MVLQTVCSKGGFEFLFTNFQWRNSMRPQSKVVGRDNLWNVQLIYI